MIGVGNKILIPNVAGASEGWNISTASFVQYITANYGTTQAVFLKPDGTKMWIMGASSDVIEEWNITTPWDLSTASYSTNKSVAAQELNPRGLWFSPDGTKCYVTGSSGDDVNQYSLSTAWSIATLTYVKAQSISGQSSSPCGVCFNPDGDKMYIASDSNYRVYEYSLSTAWDVATISYVQYVASGVSSCRDVFFSPDGTRMYLSDDTVESIRQFSLSTAWDVSTASYVQSFSTSSYTTGTEAVFFKSDGTKMYMAESTYDRVHEFNVTS